MVTTDRERIALHREFGAVVASPLAKVTAKSTGERSTARRVHSEVCLRYQAENERRAARQKRGR